MTTKAEELEQFVALGATNVIRDVSLRGLIGMNTLKVLTPRMADNRVISLPLLTELVNESIATTVNTV